MARPQVIIVGLVVALLSIAGTTVFFYMHPTFFQPGFIWNPPTIRVGQTAVINNVSIRVVAVTRTTGIAPVSAPAGYEYIVVTVFLGNGTANDLPIVPLLHFHLKDSVGRIYTVVANPNESAQLSGPLSSHDSLQEELSFLVPTGTHPLVLRYEPGQVGQSYVRILLST